MTANVFRLLDWVSSQHPHLSASEVLHLVTRGQDPRGWTDRDWRTAVAQIAAPGLRP